MQVVLALFQSVEGLPIGYELFPGSTADVRTLGPALKALRERFDIGRVVLVADAGMLSQDNLDLLASEGLGLGGRGAPAQLATQDGGRAF